ncbi:MAG: ABC transporter permease [Gemmatimonadota bacterium]|nr:ABC transporter permease [Gemmatimonadota bacterium]
MSASAGARRWRAQLEEAVLPAVVALLIAALVGDVLIIVYGQSPGEVYRALLEGTWGNAYGLGQVLYKTTTLTFTGLSVAIGLRAGLFNIGAESQLAAGGFAAGVLGTLLPPGLPALLVLPLFIVAAAIGGGAVGGAAGVLKSKWGAHEVITTIMLNFIVLALLNYLTVAHFKVFDTLHTADVRSGALPRLSALIPPFHGSAANMVLFLALAVVAVAWWYLFRSRAGYELRAVGLQPGAAEYGGVNVPGVWWRAMLISGAVAGIGGLNFVLGYKHYYEDGFSTGAGFLGIAVALVGRNNPVGVVLAALLFGTLSQGGLAVNALVPKQMVDVLQAVVIIAVVTSVPEVRRVLRSARRRGGPEA